MAQNSQTVTTDFDFHALVHELLDSSGEADPHALWREVVAAIPEHAYPHVLDILGPYYVRNMVGAHRRNVQPPVQPAPGQSRRARAYASRRLFVGEWKFLTDCTPDDLDFAILLRHDQAKSIEAEADRLQRLAKVLRERGLETVGDLSEDEIAEALK